MQVGKERSRWDVWSERRPKSKHSVSEVKLQAELHGASGLFSRSLFDVSRPRFGSVSVHESGAESNTVEGSNASHRKSTRIASRIEKDFPIEMFSL